MEKIKTSPNVEFEVIYADGTRKRVPEGVLFEAEGYHMTFHNGTNRPEVVFAAGVCIAEVINAMGATRRLKKDHIKQLVKTLLHEKGGKSNAL